MSRAAQAQAQQERRWPSPANGGNAAVSGPAAVAAAAARARVPRIMPHWVSAGGRSAVPPPPPPTRPEPDYEVIEFPTDQYVNAKLNPAPRPAVTPHCGLCGTPGARVRCHDCEGRVFCVSCDDMYHRHPKRRSHRRQPIAAGPSEDSDRPPLPPKGANALPAPPPPVPPPRRNKVGGRSDSFSSRGSRTPAPTSPLPPGTPAHLRRPLPATPPHPPHLRHLQQAPPPTASEPNTTWNRPSTAASFNSPPASPLSQHHTHDPQAWPGGGGGGWSATVDRRRSAGGPPPAGDGGLRRAPIASSVFELHRPEQYPPQHHLMQQQRFLPAQSMATLNCANCAGCQQQRAAAGEWWRFGSNASLDARMPQDGFGQPGMWVNPWLPPMPMYPHTHHTTGRPASRAHSRVTSRAVSPAASVRSRRSRHGTRRYREPDDYSDDEDSSGERRPRRRDSLRSHTRATPSPIPREPPASIASPGTMRRQDERDVTRRNGTIDTTRGESTSSHTMRDSPVRVPAFRQSPMRTHISESPGQVRALKEAEQPRVPQSMHQREATRVPQSPTSRRNVLTSPVPQTRSSSSEERSPEAETSAPTTQDALDAPPPPIPTARWQCEYCTYVNDAGTRVCEICCKTPTAPPRPASAERSTPARAELAASVDRLMISEPVRTSVERVAEKPKKGDDDYMNVRVNKAQDEAEQASVATAAEPNVEVASLGVKRVKKKTVCEKVSTGCGPSPPREAPPPSPATTPALTASAPATPGTASTGTSPLPQSISTQTYESPEEIRQAAAASVRPTSSTADESSRSTHRRSARSLRREARRSSRRSPEHTSRSERSHSRHSFSSDRSIGTPAREWSPAPAPAPDDEWWREAGPLRSRANSLLQQQRPRTSAPPRRAPPRRASHLDLYREQRDDPRWRREPFGDPYAYPDPRDVFGSQPDVTRAISLEALTAAKRQTEVIRNQGLELVKLLREAEASGFTAEEVHAATQQCGNTEPVRWLQENWAGMVASVQTVASKLGREAGSGDTVGTLSEKEAREALRRHKGSVWQAVTECVQQRQRKYGELMTRGKFSREEVLTCLTAHHGDLEAAYLDLTKNQLKPFLMKIWGPPEGVENDSANPQAGGSVALSASHPTTSGDQKAEDELVTYLDKLKKFEKILNKDTNVHAGDSVSGNYNPFMEHGPQVSEAPVAPNASTQKAQAQDIATDNILGGLKSLLSSAGIPVSDQSLLNGLKNIMKMGMGDQKSDDKSRKSEENRSQYRDLIETENDFIQAYNALTSSSPLPRIEHSTDTNLHDGVIIERIPNLSNTIQTDNVDLKESNLTNILDNDIKDNSNINSNVVSIYSPNEAIRNDIIATPVHIQSTSNSYVKENDPSNTKIINNNENNNVKVNHINRLDENSMTSKNLILQAQSNIIDNATTLMVNHNLISKENNKSELNADEKSQDLSDIVNDTHRLVQQMKDEINSDIASYDEEEQNSETENETSVTPDSSERDSYTETEGSSSGSEDEASSKFTEKNEKVHYSQQSITHQSPEQTSSSDDNEEFEEAIDNSEALNFEQSNMAALDAIVKSLQEINTNIEERGLEVTNQEIITPETNNGTQVSDERENNIAQSNVVRSSDNIIELTVRELINGNSFIEAEIATASAKVITVAEVVNEPIVVRQSNIVHEPVFLSETTESEAVLKLDLLNDPLINENEIVGEILAAINNNTISNSDIVRNVNEDNIVEEVTEDVNNNLLSVKTFEELYESISLSQPIFNNSNEARSNRSHTPEIVIREDNQENEAQAFIQNFENRVTEHINRNQSTSPDKTNTVSENNNNEERSHVASYSEKNIDFNDLTNVNIDQNSRNTPEKNSSSAAHQVVVSNDKEQISAVAKNGTSENVSKKTIIRRSSEESGKIANGIDKALTKSSIPKPKSNVGLNKNENKPPTKVILSKVPIRKNSLKTPTSPPTSQKAHFGNIQSGHVKKLQSSLFGKNETKNPKIPVPVRKKTPPKSGLALVKPMPSKIITIQSDNSNKANLKPYFQETCLSDDYLTETDDEAVRRARSPRAKSEPGERTAVEPEPEPLPVTSRLVNGKIIDFTQVPLKDGSPERQVRMLVAEGVVESWQQAEIAVALASRGETPAAALLAAHDCSDLPTAIAYLKQECELCAGHAPAFEMVSMLACTHRCCSECASTYFTVQITERSIFDCVCPFCKLPELAAATGGGAEEHEDEALEYFSRLEHQLKSVVETGVHELFQRKLRDRALLQDPNFKWCVECSSGFFVHPRQKRITCPECRSVTCAHCRKPWEKQHEGLSCEQFAEWKEANDPESSVQAVQRHLQDNGIDCPKCKFRYSLARGGCMHFTCSQCKYEFCCGCGKPFTMGARCGLSDYCGKLGLHAHHPRNCLFYLRDKEPHQLQTLLQMNNIEYKIEPADGTEDQAATGELTGAGETRPRRCPVALQRETPGGLVDTTCNGDVPPQNAGLCKVHYLEYLAGVVMQHNVDPLPVMDVSDLVAELRRRALPLPERGPWDTDPIYAGMCAEIVKEKIPLE